MRTPVLKPGSLSLFCALALGCGSSEFDNPDYVRTWVNATSAVGVYVNAHTPIAFADGQHTFEDPECPVTMDDGQTAVIAGQCRDPNQQLFVGTATVERSSDGGRTLTLEEYGSFRPGFRAIVTGTVTVRRLGDGSHSFDADFIHAAGTPEQGGVTTTTVAYSGTVEGDYNARTTWSGQGDFTREGALAPFGQASAVTVSQVLDSAVCNNQAISGQTTITFEGEQATVTYDGGSDCDGDSAAMWSFEGEDRGKLGGVVCTLSNAGARGSPAGRPGTVLLLAAALFAAVRRRSRRGIS